MPAPKHLLQEEEETNSTGNGSWSSEKKKKKRSRWANDETDKTFIPGMPTSLPADATEDQKEQYLHQSLQVGELPQAHYCNDRIEDASRRLRSGDLGIPANPEERSPSPEPIYNNEGKRMNTREYRTRKALEENRHEKIQQLLLLNSNYKPPADYKPPIVRVNDKVMIPQDDHPEINFVGLLIGPRGNTLKNLERDTGAKIIIRGKGSVKEGKIGRKDGQPLPGEDEPLHAYITANDPENVKKAVTKIHEIIKEGIEIPEEKNDLRKQQLRELALLNGTLRENDGLQKLRQIAEAQTIITNQIICSKCGGAGHIAKDCVQKTPAELANQQLMAADKLGDLPVNTITVRQDRAKMDSEYMSLMVELGQVAPETLKADLAASMLKSNPAFDSSRPSQVDNKITVSPSIDSATQPVSNAPLTLSSDYGYGGRRSRFDEFDNSRSSGGSRYGGGGNNYNRSRFDQGPIRPRFEQSNRFSSQTAYSQPPPPGSYPQPSSGFSQAPTPLNQNSWNNQGNNFGNRWGPPSTPPPPPMHMTSTAPPPPGIGSRFGAPPPPPPTSSWSQPTPAAAPWQSAAPIPPWQQQSHNSPLAPPPPPPNSNLGYGGYSSAPLPPPPPPQ